MSRPNFPNSFTKAFYQPPPGVSAQATKAAAELEKWVQKLEGFEKHAPKRGTGGCDLVRNYTMGMHPGAHYQTGMNLEEAKANWQLLRGNLNLRQLSDKVKAGDIDKDVQGRPEGEKMVNRWRYFEQKLRANKKDSVADDLGDTLKGIVETLLDLGNLLGVGKK